ncbi:RHS repeat-associated core domain-containing protein [Streptomyces brevispora]|nr:RHS repeat-associated core domain-containing protein [Streptomyces brevispora]
MSAIAVGTLAITRRKQLPFGQLRSSQSTAFGNRGFVGGTNDPTGLTHLGAREYDPTLGRFLSVDPIIDTADPAQMNAYSYAHNSPLTKSDPDGLRPDGPAGGATYNDDRWASDRGMNAGYTYKSGKWVWHQTPKSWFDPRYQAYRANPSGYKVFHYNAQKAAQARAQAVAAAKARADAARRKKESVLSAVVRGFNSTRSAGGGTPAGILLSKLGGAVIEGVAAATGLTNAKGSCAYMSFGIGSVYGASFCIVMVRRPDGSTQIGTTRSLSAGGFGKGFGGGVSTLRSNADDIGDFEGFGRDIGGGAYRGVGIEVNHETAIGTKNSQGQQVYSAELGAGVGTGFEFSAGENFTWAREW